MDNFANFFNKSNHLRRGVFWKVLDKLHNSCAICQLFKPRRGRQTLQFMIKLNEMVSPSFMGKIIKTIIIVLIVGAVFFRYFYYTDFKRQCYVKIKPSILEFSSQNIKQAIKILKYAAPEEYEKFCGHVKAINPNFACGGFNGGCYYQDNIGKKEIDISTANSGYLGWTAAVIAHETCHAMQAQEKRGLSEAECYKIGNKVLKEVINY